ncbi:hypothetical protein BGX28_009649 [Mortierella sp. GBA30]|nr:hypothetical protein BGX28_009649 [Mortierella sp. GBA30]
MTAVETQPCSEAVRTTDAVADSFPVAPRFSKRKSESVLEEEEVEHEAESPGYGFSKTTAVNSLVAQAPPAKAVEYPSQADRIFGALQQHEKTDRPELVSTAISSRSFVANTALIARVDPILLEEDALVHRIRELSSPREVHNLLDEGLEPACTRDELLKAARAGKGVDSQQAIPSTNILPNEIIIQVLESLCNDQSALLSAASVCLDWNLCATSLLYRSPKFASTLHWALFIQTLCRSKDSRRPKIRRRPSLIQSLSRSRQLSHHPPSQLVAAQIEVFGGRTQWNVSRLSSNLGEFVLRIDLSRKVVQADPQCTCAKRSEESNADTQGNCVHHPEPAIVAESIDASYRVSDLEPITNRPIAGTNPLENASDLDGYPSTYSQPLSWRRDRFASYDEPMATHGANWSMLRSMEREYRGLRTCSSSSRPTWSSLTSSDSARVPVSPSGMRSHHMVSNARHVLHPAVSQSSSQVGTPLCLSNGPKAVAPALSCGSEGTATAQRGDSSDVRFKKPIVITVSSLIQMARYCPKLELLSLGSAFLTQDNLYLETGDYESTIQPGPRAGLTFVPVVISDVAKALGQYCPNLRRLWLTGCEWVTIDALRVFVTYCRRLEALDLRHCSKVDNRLNQLFVVKDKDLKFQENELNGDSGSDGDDDVEDDLREKCRKKVLSLLNGQELAVSPSKEQTATSKSRLVSVMSALQSLQSSLLNETDKRRMHTREGAMFALVNEASSGRLGTLPVPGTGTLWPDEQPPVPQGSQQQPQSQSQPQPQGQEQEQAPLEGPLDIFDLGLIEHGIVGWSSISSTTSDYRSCRRR